MPSSIVEQIVRRDVHVLSPDDTIEVALRWLLACDHPALPAVDDRGRLVGIFGEREFMTALFPGYVKELRFAGFIPSSLDDALMRRACGGEPIRRHLNTEHIDVGEDASDLQVAEVFLHHRVLILPVWEHKRVTGLIRRSDFFRALAERMLGTPG